MMHEDYLSIAPTTTLYYLASFLDRDGDELYWDYKMGHSIEDVTSDRSNSLFSLPCQVMSVGSNTHKPGGKSLHRDKVETN
jgi:hypothetical protein